MTVQRRTTFTQDEAERYVRWAETQGGGMTSPLEKQAAVVLRAMALPAPPCPSCGAPANCFTASPDGTFSLDDGEPAYRCPGCGRPLAHGLALIGGETFWTIDHDREAAP